MRQIINKNSVLQVKVTFVFSQMHSFLRNSIPPSPGCFGAWHKKCCACMNGNRYSLKRYICDCAQCGVERGSRAAAKTHMRSQQHWKRKWAEAVRPIYGLMAITPHAPIFAPIYRYITNTIYLYVTNTIYLHITNTIYGLMAITPHALISTDTLHVPIYRYIT